MTAKKVRWNMNTAFSWAEAYSATRYAVIRRRTGFGWAVFRSNIMAKGSRFIEAREFDDWEKARVWTEERLLEGGE